MSRRNTSRRTTKATSHPAMATGIIATAYELKSTPAYSATIMFMGFDTTKGATPAAMNTTKLNTTTNRGWSG
jgi:hypothetical protein